MRLWIVEQWDGLNWEPCGVWASKSRATCFGTIAGLVKNAKYNRRHLRVRSYVRGTLTKGSVR